MRTRTRTVILLTAVVAVLFGASGVANAGVPRGDAIQNGYTLCLDAENDLYNQPNNDGDKVQLWDCGPQSNQGWTFNWVGVGRVTGYNIYEIRNKFDTNMCLDAEMDAYNSPWNNGDKVQMWYCHGSSNQHWSWEGRTLRNVSGLCLDAERDQYNNPTNNGDKVQLWTCNGERQQQWR
jgi:hypothetical protein